MKGRFSEEQIIGLLKQQEAGITVAQLLSQTKNQVAPACFDTYPLIIRNPVDDSSYLYSRAKIAV